MIVQTFTKFISDASEYFIPEQTKMEIEKQINRSVDYVNNDVMKEMTPI